MNSVIETDEFRDLLDRWEELCEQGMSPCIEELCRDAPHMIEPLREWTRVLSGGDWLSRRADDLGDRTMGEAIASLPEENQPHRVLGEYTLVGELGAGGMGRVYRAVHGKLGRTVALKLLAPAMVRSPEAVERFQREVRTLARLQHGNIVAVHDAGAAEGAQFYVMEFVEGDDLARLVRELGPMPVEQAVDCIMQTAQGLEFAHAKGIVHRDVKPSNLILDNGGTVKILDLGIARLVPDGETVDSLTQTGCVLGTIDYMAPEQAVNSRGVDCRADIYSLGCTLWYLLTGRSLYDGETVMERLNAHRERPLPSLHQACPAAPAWLEAVYRKMLAKRPADRYQTVAELISDLQRQTAPRKKRPRLVPIAAALLIGLALASIWAVPRLMALVASRRENPDQASPREPLEIPVKPSWRTTGEFPLISGTWKEAADKRETLVAVVQQGGNFSADASYVDKGRPFAWHAEGKISRGGHITMSLAYSAPDSPDRPPPQSRTAVLSPGGHSLEGYASFEGGRRKFAWRLVAPGAAEKE